MYSPKIIEKRLKRAAQHLGFEPEHHSVRQVESANNHFKDLVDWDTGKWKRLLQKDELRWIENEHALCTCDYTYWATRYAFVRHFEGGRIVRFAPNIAQKIIWQIRSEMEEEGRSLETLNLKARQLGVSTEDELAVAHRVQFYP